MQSRNLLRRVSTALVLVAWLGAASLYAQQTKIITDMCGNKVEVPVTPTKIAAMHCVSPEKIMTLGYGQSLAVMAKQSPWAYKLFPEIASAKGLQSGTPDNLKKMDVDFVLYTPGMTKENPFSSAGIKTVCAFSADDRPMKIEDFTKSFEGQVTFFGNLLGGDAKVRAAKYNAYYEKKVKQILAITSKIPEKDRPRVYYGGLRFSMLNGQGKGSIMHWNTVIAGGNYVSEALNDNHSHATMEQVEAWNPDFILVSGLADSTDFVIKDPKWAALKAVKADKVYLLPQGIYAWDHASNENVLLMIYMAKLFYPQQFKHWDMVREMKTFYSEIYGKSITDADAQRILQHLPPQ